MRITNKSDVCKFSVCVFALVMTSRLISLSLCARIERRYFLDVCLIVVSSLSAVRVPWCSQTDKRYRAAALKNKGGRAAAPKRGMCSVEHVGISIYLFKKLESKCERP